MTWTTEKPTTSGWYFYRESGKNLDKPMVAWVFTSGKFIYVSLFLPHGQMPYTETGQTKDFSGEWWGPVEVPK
jgi:hypothetical protein